MSKEKLDLQLNLDDELNSIVNVDVFTIAENKKSSRFEFINYDNIMSRIDLLIEMVENYEYKEEDRKVIKNLKAYVNSFVKDLNSNIKSQQEDLFGLILEQHKEFKNKFDILVNLLNQGIAEQDARKKEEKKQYCEDLFKETIPHYDNLKNFPLSFEDVFVTGWTNLSVTESAIKKELDSKLSNLDEFLASKLSPTEDNTKIINAFKLNDFNGMKSLNYLNEQRDKELAEELLRAEKIRLAEEERLRKENEELLRKSQLDETLVEKFNEKRYLIIEVEASDYDKAINLLSVNNIDFRRN